MRAVVVLALLTGLVYPLVMTGIAQLTMSDKADGSLVRVDGKVVGSSSIGQLWEGEEWFHGRPSAIDYDASTSSGSNLGPNSQDLSDQIAERADAILELEGPYNPGLTIADIPVDLLTASASGLDPHISVAAAELQAPRIAQVRGLSLEQVRSLIDDHTEGPTLGFLGRGARERPGAQPRARAGGMRTVTDTRTFVVVGARPRSSAIDALGRRAGRRRGGALVLGLHPTAGQQRLTEDALELAAERRFTLTAELIAGRAQLHDRLREATMVRILAGRGRAPPVEPRTRARSVLPARDDVDVEVRRPPGSAG